MVAYLKKIEGSEGFHQIFWQTATTSTLDNGDMEITATIDGKVKTVSEASIRRPLKLQDSDGISNLPTTKIFAQLALIGYKKIAWEQFSSNIETDIICLATNRKFNFSKLIFDGMGEGSTHLVESHHTPTSALSTSQPPISPTTRRTIRQESEVSQPRSPTQTLVADETVHEERGDRVERATTTAASLDIEQDSGGSPRRQETTLRDMPAQTRFERLSKQPYNSPLPRVNTLGSDEGSLKLQELTVLCTKLSTKVDSLEADLKQKKQIYGAAFTKLIKKVKTLEKTVKSSQARRKAKIVVSDDEEDLEDPSKQGRKIDEINKDPDISLVQHDAEVKGRHEHDMEYDFEFTTAEEVYTAEKRTKDKGKAIMEEAETIQTKTKLQLEQERLGYEEALRVEADEEFAQRLQSEEREMYSEAEKARLLVELINERKRYFAAQRAKERRNKPFTQAQQRTYMSQYIKNMGSPTLKQLKSYYFDEIKNMFETTMRRVHTFVLIESESERVIPELAAGSSKRDAEEELVQESSKRQKTRESSEPVEEPKDKEEELSQERIQQMMIVVPD
ncbi:hypothetical protein Tco_1370626 [Tanacetum coccineum]